MPLFEQQASSRLPILLDGLKRIGDIPSQTRDQIKQKAGIYRDAVDKIRLPLRAVADLWCASFFLDSGNHFPPAQYDAALQTLSAPPKHAKLAKEPWFAQAIAVARRGDVACFHWELEFPEVFFDKAGRRARRASTPSSATRHGGMLRICKCSDYCRCISPWQMTMQSVSFA